MVGGGPGKLKKSKPKPVYPTVRLDLDTLPEAKDWKVGKSYGLGMVVKMVGISQSRYDNSAEFEIRKIEGKDAKESDQETEEPAQDQDSDDKDHG